MIVKIQPWGRADFPEFTIEIDNLACSTALMDSLRFEVVVTNLNSVTFHYRAFWFQVSEDYVLLQVDNSTGEQIYNDLY